jgi:hypothetical protein
MIELNVMNIISLLFHNDVCKQDVVISGQYLSKSSWTLYGKWTLLDLLLVIFNNYEKQYVAV